MIVLFLDMNMCNDCNVYLIGNICHNFLKLIGTEWLKAGCIDILLVLTPSEEDGMCLSTGADTEAVFANCP